MNGLLQKIHFFFLDVLSKVFFCRSTQIFCIPTKVNQYTARKNEEKKKMGGKNES